MKRWGFLLAALLLTGCGDEPTQPTVTPPGRTITVAPTISTVLVHGSRDLTATPSSAADSSVTWRLLRDPAIPDSLDIGTLVATGPRTATYSAPPTVETGGFDYVLTALAVSASDTTVRGAAVITVPRVRVLVTPASIPSVPPGTLVPIQVVVQNAPNPDFNLYVEGIPGGDAGVGTWFPSGTTSSLYLAPVRDTLFLYGLLARSVEDPKRFGTTNVIVRPGFLMPSTDPTSDQLAPEWDPTGPRLAYVRAGSPRQLVVYDFNSQSEEVLTTFGESILGRRVAWSEDGSRLAFTEDVGGRAAIGLVNADGSGRTTFAPNPSADYISACFLPNGGAPESLYVAQRAGTDHSIRAYPLNAGAGNPGRLVYQAPTNRAPISPDAIPGTNGRPLLAFADLGATTNSVLSLVDDGISTTRTVATGTEDKPTVRWAVPSDGVAWITYVDAATHNLYRVQRSGLSPPQRCYTDFFPESGADLMATPLPSREFSDPHAISRQDGSGHHRIWIVGFPPSSVIPVRPQVERELRRMGIWEARPLVSWRAWRPAP